ncbi:hypothetical protein [Nonomuraea sp. NPDC050310]|uniref:hypothetical protein n=1 Tax=Nonomuraea sp. NPDC050310 TaxID=3154935 RepID=UPI0033E0D471
MISGRIFDVPAIVDFGTGRTQYAQAVVWSSLQEGQVIVLPAIAVAAALAQIPDNRWDAIEVLLGLPITVVTDVTRGTLPALAATLRPAATQAPFYATAAAVVLAAQQRSWPVLTGDAGPLRALWPDVRVDPLP